MFVLSSRVRLRRQAAALILVSTLALTGCTSDKGPTAAQAGQTLKNQVLQLLRERDALDVRVTDPGGANLPCGNGKARQTFAATGVDAARETTPYILRTAMLGALDRISVYKIVGRIEPTKAVRVADAEHKIQLTLDSPSNGVYSVAGETDCLPVS
jgi:hypothetical protein